MTTFLGLAAAFVNLERTSNGDLNLDLQARAADQYIKCAALNAARKKSKGSAAVNDDDFTRF